VYKCVYVGLCVFVCACCMSVYVCVCLCVLCGSACVDEGVNVACVCERERVCVLVRV